MQPYMGGAGRMPGAESRQSVACTSFEGLIAEGKITLLGEQSSVVAARCRRRPHNAASKAVAYSAATCMRELCKVVRRSVHKS